MKLLIDYSDGRYFTRPLSDDVAATIDEHDVAYLDDGVYDAYKRHCAEDGVWQALWRSIANEQSIRRRERELLPREEAQREIERLKDELARAQRLEKHYEQENQRLLRERHRSTYVEYTCVFPLPGCDVNALPPKWRERAQDILDNYSARHAADGLKIQGCCCGHEHEKLDEADTQQLRDRGFAVEHDAAEDPS